jgi:formate-dependent nitrite reductase membrane component NrfD
VTARSYYGRPILEEPVWRVEIPLYLFGGGLAGASATLALAARMAGNDALARTATFVALGGVAAGPPLLISDLGRPARFLNMLRVFKVTSPLSVGTWILTASSAAIGTAAGCEALGVLPRVRSAAQAVAGALGPALASYTGALVADSAIPVWHGARRELPLVFAAGAAASAGAAATLAAPAHASRPAHRLALLGALGELLAVAAMQRRLGAFVAEPYRTGKAGTYASAAGGAIALGAGLLALARRPGPARSAGAAVLLAGLLAERFAVVEAGRQSARDPKYVVETQRAGRGAPGV